MRRILAEAGLVALLVSLMVSLVVSLVCIVILVIATLAFEIDRLPDDPGNGSAFWHAPLEKGSA